MSGIIPKQATDPLSNNYLEKFHLSRNMSDSDIPEDITLDEKGNIDVTREIGILKKFQKADLDIEGMEELLFSDIDTYRRKRSDLLFSYDFERDSPPDDDLLVFGPDGEPEEELLLYGAPSQEVDVSLLVTPEIEEPIPGIDSTENTDDQILEQESAGKSENNIFDTTEEGNENIMKFNGTPYTMEKNLKRHVTGPKKGASIGKKGFIAIFMIVMIVFLGISGSYLLFFRDGSNEPGSATLTADFSISEIHPLAGDIVNFTCDIGEKDDIDFRWSIQPDRYTIIDGDVNSPTMELYFMEIGNYRIDLNVKDALSEETSTRYIDVENREIIIERERYGDVATHTLKGDLHIENIDELLNNRETYDYDTLDVRFFTDVNNPMETTIIDDSEKGRDGLGSEYHRLSRKTDQFIRFTGTISGEESQTTSITGNSRTVQMNEIDLFNKRPYRTRTDVLSHFSIPVRSDITWEYDVEESVTVFSDLTREGGDLRIEDIADGRNISLEEQGIAKWGRYDLSWYARQIEIIEGRTSIKVEFTMDQATKRDLDVDEFLMYQWISDDIPIPVKTVTNITSSNDVPHPFRLNAEQQLVDFTMGNDLVIYNSIDHRHELITSIDQVPGMESLEQEFHTDWDMVPKLGNKGGSIPLDFTPTDAIKLATDDQNFKLWSANKPDLLVIGSNLTTVGGFNKWTLTMAEPGEEGGWESRVIGENTQGIPYRVTPVDISRSELGRILTYSGGEYTLRELLPDIDPDTTTRIYGRPQPTGDDRVRFTELSLGTRVDNPYPRSGLVDPSLSGSIEYCLVIEAFDGSLEVGLDMANGQLSYIRTTSVSST